MIFPIGLENVKRRCEGVESAFSEEEISYWLKSIRKFGSTYGMELDEESKDFLSIVEFVLIGRLERIRALVGE